MKSILAGILLFFALLTHAQTDFHTRSGIVPFMAPFYHGVASGDPLSDRVIIWTRVTIDDAIDPNATIQVNWRMATDVSMTNVVANGITSTNALKDYTVKVDVTGLSPYTCYYYDFSFNNYNSIVGRTKTAPTGQVDSLRFAVVSCSDYENGFFNAYASIAQRNDIDAIVHLGDYIYEYEASGGAGGRLTEPANETISLTDYRTRYSHYRLDKDLRDVHQQHPIIAIWDDHETANNSWMGGADNHDPATEGDWSVRMASGKQAYLEWMPVRENDMDSDRIYRTINYGDLVNFYMLDTRLEGREEQVTATSSELNNPDRTIMGTEQFDWLKNELLNSNTKWNILGQQVMMAPLKAFGIPLNMDQWDGYPAERSKLFNFILDSNIQNIVVLTGDIHTSWANDLPSSNYNSSTGSGSVGVEYVITSVTSSSTPLGVPSSVISAANSHNKWSDLTKKGYLILDINQERTQGEWWLCNTITESNPAISLGAKYYVNNQERFLRTAANSTNRSGGTCLQAPFVDPNVGIQSTKNELVWLGAYPNPFEKEITVQYNASKAEKLTVSVLTLDGKKMKQFQIFANQGLNYVKIDGENLLSGNYQVVIENGQSVRTKRIVKL